MLMMQDRAEEGMVEMVAGLLKERKWDRIIGLGQAVAKPLFQILEAGEPAADIYTMSYLLKAILQKELPAIPQEIREKREREGLDAQKQAIREFLLNFGKEYAGRK